MDFKINCQIYPKTVHVFLSSTLKDAAREYEKKYSTTLSNIENSYQALTCYPTNDSKYFSTVIMLLSESSPTLLTDIHHESIHCAIWILKEVGVEISYNNDEAITYLSSYIFKTALQKLKLDIIRKKQ